MSINDPILQPLVLSKSDSWELETGTGSSKDVKKEEDQHCDCDGSANSGAGNSNTSGVDSKGQNFHSAKVLELEGEAPCIFPGCEHVEKDVDLDKVACQAMLDHLLDEHKLVIDCWDQVVNLRKYFSLWKVRLSSKPEAVKDVLRGINVTGVKIPSYRERSSGQADDDVKITETGFYLSSELEQDKEIRSQIWQERLKLVLEAFLKERRNRDFSRRCLFCPERISGNRRDYFRHTQDQHGFFVGDPDNIIFANEFIDMLEKDLNDLKCLYCAHTFVDKNTLKEHMRKKRHRKIKSDDGRFDKFYSINYLEVGRKWNDVMNENLDEEERAEDEWTEPNYESRKVRCLFCLTEDPDYSNILQHMKESHRFDFETLTSKTCYHNRVKVVNYMRRSRYFKLCFLCQSQFEDIVDLDKHLGEQHDLKNLTIEDLQKTPYLSPEYFFVTYEDDEFLINVPFPEWEGDQMKTTVVM